MCFVLSVICLVCPAFNWHMPSEAHWFSKTEACQTSVVREIVHYLRYPHFEGFNFGCLWTNHMMWLQMSSFRPLRKVKQVVLYCCPHMYYCIPVSARKSVLILDVLSSNWESTVAYASHVAFRQYLSACETKSKWQWSVLCNLINRLIVSKVFINRREQ